MGSIDERKELCRQLGFNSLIELHKTIVEGSGKGAPWMLQRRLDSENLTKLGYTMDGMRKLGYSNASLKGLGFFDPGTKTPPPSAGGKDGKATPAPKSDRQITKMNAAEIRELINKGNRASALRGMGVTVHLLRYAGIDAREVYQLGFSLDEMANEYTPRQLKAAGFGVRDMRKYNSGAQLRNLGYSAMEMRTAGFTVRDLINFGYNENQIIGAGYSINELVREGLSNRTVDRSKF